jgi:hypothetical protein
MDMHLPLSMLAWTKVEKAAIPRVYRKVQSVMQMEESGL